MFRINNVIASHMKSSRHVMNLDESKKDEKAVHCSDPELSFLVMFGVSKRLSRTISLVVYCLSL